jgi:hypothetical protein
VPAENSQVVQLPFSYRVNGRQGRRVLDAFVVESTPVAFEEMDPSDAPVVAKVEREIGLEEYKTHLSMRTLLAGGAFPRQPFEYRLVQGGLMRSVLDFNGTDMMTLERFAKTRAADGQAAFFRLAKWRDHVGARAGWRAESDEKTEFFQNRPEFTRLESDGRDETLAETCRKASALRLVGGVLFKPAPPPAWGVTYKRGGKVVTAFVPEYDCPALYASPTPRHGGASTTGYAMPIAVFHARIPVNEIRTAAGAAFEMDVGAQAEDRLEVADPKLYPEAALEDVRARVTSALLAKTMNKTAWQDVPTALRSRLASLDEALQNEIAAGPGGSDSPRASTVLLQDVRAILESAPENETYDETKEGLWEMAVGACCAASTEDLYLADGEQLSNLAL